MTDFPPFSQLLSRATVQALQMRCLTFSRVNWLRNGELSKVGEYIWRTLYISHSILVKELDFQCRILKLLHSWKLPEISWNSGYWPGIGQFWLISIYRVYFPLNSSQETWFSMQNLKITSFLEVSRAISRVPGNFWKFPGMM